MRLFVCVCVPSSARLAVLDAIPCKERARGRRADAVVSHALRNVCSRSRAAGEWREQKSRRGRLHRVLRLQIIFARVDVRQKQKHSLKVRDVELLNFVDLSKFDENHVEFDQALRMRFEMTISLKFFKVSEMSNLIEISCRRN